VLVTSPGYPDEVFDLLERLITDAPRTVLDIGAGEGAIARPLALRVDHVDAVDASAAMIARLGGPYALVTAGAPLHWMSWKPVLARLIEVMSPNAFLALVEHGHADLPWGAELTEVITRHSRSPGYDPGFSIVDALAAGGLLEITGRAVTAPVPFRQRVASYVEQFLSTASLAREWMPGDEGAAFGRAVADVVTPYASDGVLELTAVAHVTWGRPVP
jgi:SAM-dependent methyltransferase